jgi:hypothetical protein
MSDRWSQRSFARDIRAAAPFLFDQYCGKIAEFPRREAHDPNQSYGCMATSSLIFEFSGWRGENSGVRVSPGFSPRDAYDVLQTLRAIDPEETSLPRIMSWQQLGRFLEPRFLALKNAFRQENFSATKVKLALLQSGKR